MNDINWSHIHRQNKSWRQQILGDASSEYVLSRYMKIFRDAFDGSPSLSFLEVGSGNGDLSKLITEAGLPYIDRYVTSECFSEGVDWLKNCGLEALQLDAQKIDLPDRIFDVVISFDVMHHVNDPAAMAREMVRVSRGRLLLTEANGMSLGRKLMEHTPGHRTAGEQSYLPSTYKRFFSSIPGIRILKIQIYPFLFMFKTPSFLVSPVIFLSKTMEFIPLVRWQCANLCLYIEFERLTEE